MSHGDRCPYCGSGLGRRLDPGLVAIVAMTVGILFGNSAGARIDGSLGPWLGSMAGFAAALVLLALRQHLARARGRAGSRG